jgi:CO/xanthine dehydrogenase FAD-binding subunit
MKPPAFDYVAVTSADEAVAELARHGDAAKLLAGGQSLVPILNLRLAAPSPSTAPARSLSSRSATAAWRSAR